MTTHSNVLFPASDAFCAPCFSNVFLLKMHVQALAVWGDCGQSNLFFPLVWKSLSEVKLEVVACFSSFFK